MLQTDELHHPCQRQGREHTPLAWRLLYGQTSAHPAMPASLLERRKGGMTVTEDNKPTEKQEKKFSVENLENRGNYIAKRIRWIYLRKPYYRGPEIK